MESQQKAEPRIAPFHIVLFVVGMTVTFGVACVILWDALNLMSRASHGRLLHFPGGLRIHANLFPALFMYGLGAAAVNATVFAVLWGNPSRGARWISRIAGASAGLTVAFFLVGLSPASHKDRVGGTSCLNNLKQLATAYAMYSSEHDGYLPPVDRWSKATDAFVRNLKVYSCPSTTRPGPESGIDILPLWGYAMNSLLDGLKLDEIAMPDDTVLLFEAVPGGEIVGGPELFPKPPRHRQGHAVVYVSGRAEYVPEKEIRRLNWWPRYTENREAY